MIEREPAWSPDGARIAFAANHGAGFDIYTASTRTGAVEPVTSLPGDERWPSWTPDGRLVFAHRDEPAKGRVVDPGLQWDLYLIAQVVGSAAWQAPMLLTQTKDNETEPRVSPNGERVVFVSDRDSEDDVDLWAMTLPSRSAIKPTPLGAHRPAERPRRCRRACRERTHTCRRACPDRACTCRRAAGGARSRGYVAPKAACRGRRITSALPSMRFAKALDRCGWPRSSRRARVPQRIRFRGPSPLRRRSSRRASVARLRGRPTAAA